MEWHCLAVLSTVWLMSVYDVSSENETTTTARGMVAFCNPDQKFICLNLTHYTPCVIIHDESTGKSQQRQYYCGDQRCCRPGADSPCVVHCRGPIFPPEEYVLMWNFRQFKKTIRKHVPLDSEEIERRNKIISVKNFIVRQKDLEISEEDYEDEREWKPSYRTFCPAHRPWIQPTTTTALDVTTTSASGGCGCGCCCCCCCNGCNGKTSTSTEITKITAGVTTKMQNKITTTAIKPTTTTSIFTCKKHGQKIPSPLNCAHYYLCIRKTNGKFEAHRRVCPRFYFFSFERQKCLPMEEVECNV